MVEILKFSFQRESEELLDATLNLDFDMVVEKIGRGRKAWDSI